MPLLKTEATLIFVKNFYWMQDAFIKAPIQCSTQYASQILHKDWLCFTNLSHRLAMPKRVCAAECFFSFTIGSTFAHARAHQPLCCFNQDKPSNHMHPQPNTTLSKNIQEALWGHVATLCPKESQSHKEWKLLWDMMIDTCFLPYSL